MRDLWVQNLRSARIPYPFSKGKQGLYRVWSVTMEGRRGMEGRWKRTGGELCLIALTGNRHPTSLATSLLTSLPPPAFSLAVLPRRSIREFPHALVRWLDQDSQEGPLVLARGIMVAPLSAPAPPVHQDQPPIPATPHPDSIHSPLYCTLNSDQELLLLQGTRHVRIKRNHGHSTSTSFGAFHRHQGMLRPDGHR